MLRRVAAAGPGLGCAAAACVLHFPMMPAKFPCFTTPEHYVPHMVNGCTVPESDEYLCAPSQARSTTIHREHLPLSSYCATKAPAASKSASAMDDAQQGQLYSGVKVEISSFAWVKKVPVGRQAERAQL